MDEIERRIIELVADDERLEPDDLAKVLADGGEELPIDSVLTAVLIPTLEDEFDVEIPTDDATAQSLRSIRALARRIADLQVAQNDGGEGND